MSIFIDRSTKVVVQGIGSQGTFHARRNKDYGTQVVAGTHPKKGGTTWDELDVPVFTTVKESVEETGANTSMVMVPAPFTKDAILEAHAAGIGTIVVITEGVPVHDGCRRLRTDLHQPALEPAPPRFGRLPGVGKGGCGVHRPQRIVAQRHLEVGDQQFLVLLLVMQAEHGPLQDLLGVRTRIRQQPGHGGIDGRPVVEDLGHRRPRQIPAPGPGILLADGVVVAVEQVLVAIVRRAVSGQEGPQKEGLEEPGGVGQVPAGRARLGTGLDTHVLHLEVRGQRQAATADPVEGVTAGRMPGVIDGAGVRVADRNLVEPSGHDTSSSRKPPRVWSSASGSCNRVPAPTLTCAGAGSRTPAPPGRRCEACG